MEDGTPGPLAFDGSTMRPRPLPDRNSIRSPSCSSSLSPTSSAKVTFLRLVKEGLSSTIFLVRGWSVIESDFLELSSNPSNGNDAISRLSRLDGPAPTEDELKDRRTGVKSLGTSKGECRRNEKFRDAVPQWCTCVLRVELVCRTRRSIVLQPRTAPVDVRRIERSYLHKGRFRIPRG